MKWLLAMAALVAGFGLGIWSRERPDAPSPPSSGAPQAPPPAASPQGPDAPALAQVLATLGRKPGLKELAALAQPLSRLTPEQMAALMAELKRDPRDPQNNRGRWLFGWWLEHDPEAASAWLLPVALKAGEVGPLRTLTFSPEGEMTLLWAKAFPDRALDFARAHPASGVTTALLAEVLGERLKTQPLEAWAALRDFPPCRARSEAIAKILPLWANQDASGAFAAALALPAGPDREAALAATLPSLAGKNPAAAFAQYAKLEMTNPKVTAELAAQAAAIDPVRTADWLSRLDRARFGRAAPGLVEKWAAQDPAAAFAWAIEHQVRLKVENQSVPYMEYDGPNLSYTSKRDPGSNAPLAAMEKKPAETLAWMRSLPAGADRERMAGALMPFAQPADAVQLFAELPASERSMAAYTLGKKIAGNLPLATSWAESLPAGSARANAWESIGSNSTSAGSIDPAPGADRDAWLTGRIRNIHTDLREPEATLDLIPQISDPVKRRKVFDRVLEDRLDFADAPGQKEKIQQWLEKADVPADWKEKWQKK